jgi:2'-5' RNA ligase
MDAWEGCLAYAISCPLAAEILEARRRLEERRPEAPAHLQLPPHVTVKYLGHRRRPDLDALLQRLRMLPTRCVEVEVIDVGVFTREGVSNIHLALEQHEDLLDLQRAAEAKLLALGLDDGDRCRGPHYRPHITIIDGIENASPDADPSLRALVGRSALLRELVLFRKPVEALRVPEIWARWG